MMRLSFAPTMFVIALMTVLGGCASDPDWAQFLPGQTGGIGGSKPNSVDWRLARAAMVAGDVASAVRLYQAEIKRQPQNPELQLEFGQALIVAGSMGEGIDVLNGINPKSKVGAEAAYSLGKAYLVLTQETDALSYFEKAEALKPSDHRILTASGVALDLLRRHAEAQDRYRAALRISPRNEAARNNLALSLALSGQYKEALDIIGPLARLPTAAPRIRQNQALIYGLMGDDMQAGLASHGLSDDDRRHNLAFYALVRE